MQMSKKIVGIVMILLGVFLVSPALNMNVYKLQIGGAEPTVYWHYPYSELATPSQLIADCNHVPWIIIYTPDETNYTEGWSAIDNYLGNIPWPVNGTLQVSGAGFSTTAKLQLASGQKMQVGYLYSFGLGSDWQTNMPWHEGDPIPDGSTIVPVWNDPTQKLLCTPGTLYQLLREGVVYTFAWMVNVPDSQPLTALGYGKKYYNLQGIWTLNNAPIAPVAVNVSISTLTFSFMPTVGAVNITSAYVNVLRRGDLAANKVTLSKMSSGNYTGAYSLGQEGVYDVNCYFTDAYGTVYAPTGTIVIYGGNAQWSLTPLRLGGFGAILIGLALIVLDKKRRG